MSMIICKECGKEISDQAPNCPNCGIAIKKVVTNQKKKESTLSILSAIFTLFGCTSLVALILALVDLNKNDDEHNHTGSKFAIVMFIIYCSVLFLMFFTDSTSNTNTNTNTTTTTVQEENTQADDVQVGNNKEFVVNGLKVTVDNYTLDYTNYSDEYNVYAPNDGYKYIEVSFTYENSNNSDKYVSIYDFDCYADGTLCEQTYLFGGDFINANLSSGRNVSFSTYYVVPKESKNIELEYTANMWTNEKKIIKLD